MLVGLRGIAAHQPVPPRRDAIPGRPHGMRAILDHLNAVRIAHRHQRVHVAQMPAHMRQHQNPRAGLADHPLQMGQINHQIAGHIDKHRHRAHGGNRAGHRGQCERVGQNRIARANPHGPQRRPKRIAPRRHGQRELCTGIGGEFLFQQGDLGHLIPYGVVAVQASAAHHGNRGLDPCLGDGFLLSKGAGEPFHHAPLGIRRSTIPSRSS